ncbi:phage protease [Candidatus Thiodictyon syntrophicum]|jgi:phage I-like protein|uniref:Protease (I) and scaffold (Z) protein n=1 Tax=Candidatus Thiodictyon syntrophicum TaxID=1166950 RepID=A0A2K8U788_9GAMM|nr:phage protease [Candidatus Thiodictyon syntrophicum]AUB81446.1 hypothetical protein THSYN_11105 [Candidatus Thiodictyon syntrophicum]
MSPPPRIAALALPATVGAAQLLLPAGTFDAPRGAMLGAGPWHLSEAQGRAQASALAQHAADLPIDYEHQTLRAADNGQPAPAAGWICPADILYEAGRGLVAATVHWTERAAAYITAGEYRYLSPVFTYGADGAVRELLHLALTNTPALDYLPEVALAAASLLSHAPAEAPMDDMRERVLYLLNLPMTTNDAELLAELDKLKALLGNGPDGTAATSLPALLAERDTRIAALTAQVQAAPPADLITELRGQVAALMADGQARARTTLLAAAVADGRLPRDGKLFAYAQQLNPDALTALLADLPPIAALSGTQTGGQAPAAVATDATDGGPFTAALAAEFGTEDAYRAYQRAEQDGRIKHFGGTK